MAANLDIILRAQNQASRVINQVRNDLRGLESSAGGISGVFANTQKVIGAGMIAAGAAGVAAVAGLGAAFVKTAADGVRMATDMEAQLSNIAAVFNTTRDEIEPLKNLIMELGINPNLKVSAQEAADAIEMLGKNGLTMQEILGGAAEATVLLANSTGAEFANAADIATDAMAIFGISAENMLQAVDGISAVTVASKFDIDDYRLALAQAGGVAQVAGVEFDDFNTVIAGISPLFASGSDAGTSLKNMLVQLSPSTNKAAEAMRELGLFGMDTNRAMQFLRTKGVRPLSTDYNTLVDQLFDVALATGIVTDNSAESMSTFMEWTAEMGVFQNAFYDANGQLKDMGDIAGLLQEALSGLSEEQQTLALKTIFGNDSMRAAAGLAKLGAEGFRELQDTMANTSAVDQAATRMDNLQGAIEILGGVIDTLKLRIGDAFIPVIRAMVEALTAFLDRNADRIVGFFERFASAMTGVIPSADALTAMFLRLSIQFLVFKTRLEQDIGQSLLRAGIWLRVFAVQAEPVLSALSSLAQRTMEIVGPIAAAIASMVSWKDVLVALGLVIASIVLPALLSIAGSVLGVAAVLAGLTLAVALVRNAWENDWLSIRTTTLTSIGAIIEVTNRLSNWLQTELPAAISTAKSIWQELGMAFKSKDFSLALEDLQRMVRGIETVISDVVSRIPALWKGMWKGLTTGDFSSFQTELAALARTLGIDFANIASEARKLKIDLSNAFAGVRERIQPVVDAVSEFGAGVLKAAANAATAVTRGAGLTEWFGRIKAAVAPALDAISNFVATVSKGLSGALGRLQEFGTSINIGGLVADIKLKIVTAIEDIDWSSASTALQGIGLLIIDTFAGIDWTSVADAANRLKEFVTTQFAAIDWSGVLKAITAFRDAVADTLAGLDWSGATTSVADGLNGVIEAINNADLTADAFAPVKTRFVNAVLETLNAIDWSGVATVLVAFPNALIDFLNTIDWSAASSALSKMSNAVLKVLADIDWSGAAQALSSITGAVTDAFAQLDWSLAAQAVSGLLNAVIDYMTGLDWSAVGTGLGNMVNAIVDIIGNVQWGQLLSGKLEGFTTFISAFFDTVDWGQITTGLQTLVTNITTWAANIDWAPVTGAFTKLVMDLSTMMGAVDWSEVTEKFTSLVTQIVEWAAGIDWSPVTTALAGLQTAITDYIAGIEWSGSASPMSRMVDSITGFFNNIDWSGAGAALGNLVNRVTEFLANIDWSSAANNVNGLLTGIAAFFASADWGSLVSAGLGGLITFIKSFVDTVDWSQVTTGLMNLPVAIVAWAVSIDWTPVTGAFTRLVTDLVTMMSTIDWSEVTEKFSSLVNQIVEWAAAIDWTQVTQRFVELVVTIVNWAAAIDWTPVTSALSSLVTSVTAYFGEISWEGVRTAVTNFAQSVVSAVQEVFGELITGAGGALNLDFSELTNWTWPTLPELFTGWDWPSLPDLFANWSWPSLPELFIGWTWPEPTALLTWVFPSPTALLNWDFPPPEALLAWIFPAPTQLLAWVFPSPTALLTWVFPSPAALLSWRWPSLPTWRWPSIPTPSWLGALLGALRGGGSNPGGGGGGGGRGGFNDYRPPIFPVGRGSPGLGILSNGLQPAGATVYNFNVTVSNDLDAEAFMRRLETRIRRSQR